MAQEVDDDNIVESWEDFDENPEALEEQLKKMSFKKRETTIGKNDSLNIIITHSDGQQIQYPLSQEPKIMILKRPQPVIEPIPNGIDLQKSKQPPKTLQQRQADYAQARLRILGNSGSSPEDPKVKEIYQTQLSNLSICMESNLGSIIATEGGPTRRCSNTNASGMGKPIAIVKPSQVNVLRTPRGPSDLAGFNSRTGTMDPT